MAILPVKWYSAEMEGASTLSDSWGQLTTLLDRVLIDGFTARTASSITRSGTIVTVTFAASHKFLNDSVIEISGASEADYNGQWRVMNAQVLSFQFDIGVLTPATPATGTISVRVPPLGWERLFSDTVGTSTDQGGRRVYRSMNPLSNKNCLRIEDFRPPNDFPPTTWGNYTTTYQKFARVAMAQNYTTSTVHVGAIAPYNPVNPNQSWVSTGTGGSATVGRMNWFWSRHPHVNSTSTTPLSQDPGVKTWVIIGDDRGFYFFSSTWASYNAYGYSICSFTDFPSLKQNDPYNTILTGWDTTDTTIQQSISNPWYTQGGDYYNWGARTLNSHGKLLLKNWTGTGNFTNAYYYTLNFNNSTQYTGYSNGIGNYNLPDYSQIITSLYIRYYNVPTTTHGPAAGKMPGIYFTPNVGQWNILFDRQIMTDIQGFPGRKFMNLHTVADTSPPSVVTAGRLWMDITGPWW